MSFRSISGDRSKFSHSRPLLSIKPFLMTLASIAALVLVYGGFVRGPAGFSLLIASVCIGTAMYRSALHPSQPILHQDSRQEIHGHRKI